MELHPEDHLTYNKLAWSLATHSDPKRLNPAKAVSLAERAIALAPTKAMYWNTLGLARYRAGEYESAIAALEKSEKLFQSKSTPLNTYVLAMAHWQLGQQSEALDWYKKAVASMDGHTSNNEELDRFRKEAEALIETAADKKIDDNNN